ncbi:Lrp/AsnC family transcriptional regulator [Micrococcus terreus]|uniref:Lrp/AsnC family transcriptional regulator n=1 Tax=Micrococcus terreus TaxID=574650 RepID=UPI00254A9C2A|nr:Lrp/AsnC family transcriptional regulator [Micrococcus terreus]MDK7701640.1 Lrp/AsnC family transcriptional regulator [Micrococcus terreus]WOO96657.1 Lrp/AsnC family transcriptional regulator [Micrococcus terreus]
MPDPDADLPELSPLDLSLINLLQFAPRITWGEAGEILGTHPTTLAVRWDRLRESGAAWMTAQIQIEPGPAGLAFIELESRSDLIPETLAALVAMREVVSVESFSGERNLGLTVTACNLAELSTLAEEKISRVPGVKGLRVLLASQLHSTGDSWRLKVLSPEQVERAQAAAAAQAKSRPRRSGLTEEHWAVAQVLMRDGRASAAEIARSTGLHPATARRHLQKVLASGAIRLRCDLAQSLSGHPLTVQWFTRLNAADHAAAAARLSEDSRTRVVASITGDANFLVVMWLKNVAEIMEAEQFIQSCAPEISIQQSVVSLRQVKRMGWVLDQQGLNSGEFVLPQLPLN